MDSLANGSPPFFPTGRRKPPPINSGPNKIKSGFFLLRWAQSPHVYVLPPTPTLPIYTRTSQKKTQRCPHHPTLATHPYDVYTLTSRLPTLLSGLISPPTRYLSLPTPALLTADPLVPVYSVLTAQCAISYHPLEIRT